ncbi:MAG: hypothetical protein WD448_05340 [Woeseia sp.]
MLHLRAITQIDHATIGSAHSRGRRDFFYALVRLQEMNDDNSRNSGDIDVHVTASRDVLSMKAKGAGVLILLVLSIPGIIIVAYLMSTKDSNRMLILPLMFLIYITYELIATLDEMLGLIRRRVGPD